MNKRARNSFSMFNFTKPSRFSKVLVSNFPKLFKFRKVLMLFLLLPLAGQAQTRTELGKPILTAWLPKDYGADTQNWAIVQDDRGVMYFGNTSGILEYDGVSWRLIQFPNKNGCRSLAKDANGRIYAGGLGDFGYLASDSVGQMRFVSLLPQVPENAREFADVWQTYVVQRDVYFETYNYVFRWTPSESALQDSEIAGEMKRWQPENTFHVSFVVDNVFYIREWEKGLLRMQGDSLQLVPGGEQFANERIYVMLPYGIPPNPPCQRGEQLSLRGAKRRSNPLIRCTIPGDCFASLRSAGLAMTAMGGSSSAPARKACSSTTARPFFPSKPKPMHSCSRMPFIHPARCSAMAACCSIPSTAARCAAGLQRRALANCRSQQWPAG